MEQTITSDFERLKLASKVQKGYKVKSKLTKLLTSLDSTKSGFVNTEAFFQMLALHEIYLSAEDKVKLKNLCQIKANMIKFKDAIALLAINRNLSLDGLPLRNDEGYWILQLPQKKSDRKKNKKSDEFDDLKSQLSQVSVYTDVSIDPYIRSKAEHILRTVASTDRLSVIQEESRPQSAVQRTQKELYSYGKPDFSRQNEIDVVSKRSRTIQNTPKPKDLFEANPKNPYDSMVDQDDYIGTFKPTFLTKKKAVSGRTDEILKMQRLASNDKIKGILTPLLNKPQFDEKSSGKRIYMNKNHSENHLQHQIDDVPEYDSVGYPLKYEHFFRKAADPSSVMVKYHNHDKQIGAKGNDMSILNLGNEVMKAVNDLKISETNKELICIMLQQKQDYRSLIRLKNSIFVKDALEEISLVDYREEVTKNKNFFASPMIENMFQQAIVHEGKVSKRKLLELIDAFEYIPHKIVKNKNQSDEIYFIMNSNMRGHPAHKEYVHNVSAKQEQRVVKLMALVGTKLEEKFKNFNKAFKFFDDNGDLQINMPEFRHGIEKLKIKLNQEDIDLIFNHLDKDGDGTVSYKEFTEFSEEKRRKIDPFYSFEHQKKIAINREIEERLEVLRNVILVSQKLDERHKTLPNAFKFFDGDNDGSISKEEFQTGLLNKMKVKMAKQEVDLVFDYLDQDKDGTITYQEFQELAPENRNKIANQKKKFQNSVFQTQSHINLTRAMIMIANVFDDKFSGLKSAFQYFDTDNNGIIDRQEFQAGITRLKLNLTKNDINMVFNHLDKDKDNQVSFKEFIEFQIDRSSKDNRYLTQVMIYLANKLDEKFTNLQQAFKFFDTDGDGCVVKSEFCAAVEKMKLSLSVKDIEMVYEYLDKDKNGKINFTEFMQFERGSIIQDRIFISRVSMAIMRKIEDRFDGDIREAFKAFDADKDGSINKTEFVESLSQLRVPYSKQDLEMVFMFLDKNRDGKLQVNEFCELETEKRRNMPAASTFRNSREAKQSVKNNLTYLATKLIQKCGSLLKAFQFLDIDGDQSVNKAEFFTGLEKLDVKMSRNELIEVFDYLDIDQDNSITQKEFVQLNQNVKLSHQHKPTPPQLLKTLNQMSRALLSKYLTMNLAFQHIDIDGDQSITKHEFASVISKIETNLSSSEIDLVFDYLDENKDGSITFDEFQAIDVDRNQVIKVKDTNLNRISIQKLLKQVAEILSENFDSVQMAFRYFDTDKDGSINSSEFFQGMKSLKVPLKESELETIFNKLDSNADGELEQSEFQIFRDLISKQENQNYIDLAKFNNDQQHKTNLVNFVSQKLDSKFNSNFSKAFKFFDLDNDLKVNKQEFIVALIKLNIKLSKKDLDILFDTLDSDRDGSIQFNEFSTLKKLSSQKITQQQNEDETERIKTIDFDFEELESTAERLKLVNREQILKARQGGLPEFLKHNKHFSYGISSGLEDGDVMHKGSSSMSKIMAHTDNLKQLLIDKIQRSTYETPLKSHMSRGGVNHTNSSNLKSKSVLAKKALFDLDQQLHTIKLNKDMFQASYNQIEKQKTKLERITKLPPIEQMASLAHLIQDKGFQTIDQQKREPSLIQQEFQDSLDSGTPQYFSTLMQQSQSKSIPRLSTAQRSEKREMMSKYFANKRTLTKHLN